jgi:hypothetical protein
MMNSGARKGIKMILMCTEEGKLLRLNKERLRSGAESLLPLKSLWLCITLRVNILRSSGLVKSLGKE